MSWALLTHERGVGNPGLLSFKGRKESVTDLVSLIYDTVCWLVGRVQGKELRVTTGARCCGG